MPLPRLAASAAGISLAWFLILQGAGKAGVPRELISTVYIALSGLAFSVYARFPEGAGFLPWINHAWLALLCLAVLATLFRFGKAAAAAVLILAVGANAWAFYLAMGL